MKNRQGKRLIKRSVIFALVMFLFIILIVYVGVINKYKDVFCKDTIINGVDCSLLTIEEAENLLKEKEEQYVLEIKFKDEETEYITGAEIGRTRADLNKKLNMFKERQRKDILLRGGTYDLGSYVYDSKKLMAVLSSKKQLQEDYMEKMTKIQYVFNSDSKCFEIGEENIYYLDLDQVFEEASKAIEEGKTSISMQNLYLTSENDSTLEDLNSLISAKITYQLPDGGEYVLDADTLYTWLAQDEEGNYFKDEEFWNQNIEEFVTSQLSSLTDIMGEKREFRPTGKDSTIFIEGGNYGYQLDKEAEIQQLKKELENQEIVNREPCYQKKEISSENYGLGKSYVEIDLTRQKVWVYVDGKLEVETDCVTGCVTKGHETPTGIYTLTYKEKDRILRGDKLPNGKYSYQSHVDYWMPFNGGIGLHDASWRNSFGGDIYINNGSHGCINLPLEAAEKLYDIINSEMPIIVYKSE